VAVRYDDNGSMFVGEWENDKKNGKGLYYTLKGSRYDGSVHIMLVDLKMGRSCRPLSAAFREVFLEG
jgi:hypothetical protein